MIPAYLVKRAACPGRLPVRARAARAMSGGMVATLAGMALLAGCANRAPAPAQDVVVVPPAPKAPKTTPGYKVGQPYQVGGVWYYPQVDYAYDETGIASWYGPGFHQEVTANGEIFDQNELTAAHKTLPMPCLVRVTNLENGRSIVVRVNDRGPFAAGRIIDLSRKSAQLLGMEQQGTAKVRVQILADESRAIAVAAMAAGGGQVAGAAAGPAPTQMADGAPIPRAAPRPSVQVQGQALPPVAAGPTVQAPTTIPGQTEADGRFLPAPVVQQVAVTPGAKRIYIQAGAFTLFDNANRLRAKLSGIGPAFLAPTMVGQTQFFRVRLGPIDTVDQADQMLAQVLAGGDNSARIIVE